MPEYQPFKSVSQPKPSTFNLMRIDTRPDKGWDFDDMLQNKQQGLNGQAGQQETAEEIAQKVKAEKQLARELSAITSGTKFLSTEQKLDMEVTGTRFNKERFNEDSYISKEQMKAMLPGGNLAVTAAAAEELKKKKKISELDSDDEEDDDGEVRKEGVDNTFIHNASLYRPLTDRNPFKKGAAEQRDQFNAHFSDMGSQFMSGLSSLAAVKPDMFDAMNQKIEGVLDRYSHRSIEGVNDPYFSDVEKFDLNMDWYDVFTSPEVFNGLTHEERFFVVMSTYEDQMRYRSVSANMFGAGVDSASGLEVLNRESPIVIPGQALPVSEAAATEALDTSAIRLEDSELEEIPVFDPTADSKMTAEKSQAAAEAWWDAVGENIDSPGKLMAAGLVPAMVDSVSDLTNWGDLKIPEDKAEAFNDPRRVFIEGYFKHMDKNFTKEFQTEKRVNPGLFKHGDDGEASQVTYNLLVSKKYITKDGRITPRFEYENPEFEFDLGLSEDRESAAYNVLMTKLLGDFSFDMQDKSYESGAEKKSIKVKDSQGNMTTLDTLIESIGEGKTWEDKLKNSRNVYDTVLSMYMSMVGLGATNVTNGSVQSSPVSLTNELGESVESNNVQVAMHSDSEWLEWNELKNASEVMGDDGELATIYEGGWESKTGEPLVMNFSDDQSAQAFADKLLALTQFLAPLLGMFDQKELKVLTTDSLSLDGGDEKTFRLQELRPLNDDVFEDAQKFMTNKIGSKIGLHVVDKSQVNRLLRGMHRRKKARYFEAKEEHQQTEYHRLVNEYKKISERRKERKRAIMKTRAQHVKQQREIKKREMERKAEDNKRRARNMKANRRSSKQSSQAAAKKQGAS